MNIRNLNGPKRILVGAPLALTTLLCLLIPWASFAQGAKLLTTFTNPESLHAVAAFGTDRVLIGAPAADSSVNPVGAYLFSTNGTLLTRFTNFDGGDYFGHSVTAFGTDRVLIGSHADYQPGDGHVHLFSTNGALLTTITNPNPAISYFGVSVAAVGTDRILVGASGTVGSGTAYLFSTNGVLITTFPNPTSIPDDDDSFGWSVAALGADRVLIGAYSFNTSTSELGAVGAYLFSTNGTLLTSFTNFNSTATRNYAGVSVAALGTDRVLIGARGENVGATNAGAAYLLDTNGVWLATFNNPTPALDDFFGYAVAAAGTDRILIGALLDDTGGVNVGAAYVFNTNGALLATLLNPTPVGDEYTGEEFGRSLAALANDRVLIGTDRDIRGGLGFYSGAAYLFSLEPGTAMITITIAIASEGNVDLTVYGQAGRTYVVECSTDTVTWTQIASGTMPQSGSMKVRDATNKSSTPTSTANSRFYRAVELP